MEDVLVPIVVVGILFLGLPWLIFHYVTQWKKNGGLTVEDERLLDDMHLLARRLDERLGTLERILDSQDPAWRPRQSVDRAHDEEWRRDS
ncbi:envelope stress response membrane protein PspB [Sphingomonadaceae bacterium G21617-S1]|jgi:phage shock protein B|uniref:envelope stress response membrane protein PspB n=1 Tax=Rhizorhabdus sp. TaxID=1968843 RepID=UPI00121DF51D|nr:envelope stress response membrane protein PspB [Rhizorhabdus sp.]MBD3762760.1 envelope stress response membrane protein PspB [Rhizorhabdus sp.]MCZ4342582.1 envelope stress response membrane protein PspB [Sphingomonadaceae bacterium G21617-S1]TAK09022.1 MAG: envelope stress response membrane protein PspB [Rhizorhabdus sp.]